MTPEMFGYACGIVIAVVTLGFWLHAVWHGN